MEIAAWQRSLVNDESRVQCQTFRRAWQLLPRYADLENLVALSTLPDDDNTKIMFCFISFFLLQMIVSRSGQIFDRRHICPLGELSGRNSYRRLFQYGLLSKFSNSIRIVNAANVHN